VNLRPPAVVVGVVIAALLGSLVLGAVDVPWAPAHVAVTAAAPEAGGTVCAAGGGATERTVDMVLAAPPAADPDAPVQGRGILLAVEEDVVRNPVGPFLPGSVAVVRTDLGVDGWSWTGWADAPLHAWREWRSPGAPGEPRASVVSRCVPADAPEWVVLGLRTDGGNEALLDIVNPYIVDATFAVSFRTEAETLSPIALRNVSVLAGSSVSVRINDHLPEEADIAAVVSVGAGRLAVQGLQRATAGVGGVEGVSTVPALIAPAVTWTLPWLETGPDIEGAVWILNPAPRQVVVEVVLHTSQGAGLAESIERVELPAGGFVRVDAADLAPAGRRTFGLTLRSETSGVFVAAGARFLSDDAARTGLVGLVPSAAPDREWLDAGLHAPGRETVLHVVNLAEDVAVVRVDLTTGPTGLPPRSETQEGPDVEGASLGAVPVSVRTLEPGVLAPGAVMRIILPLDGRVAWSAVVSGGEALVVSRTTVGAVLLEPVAIDALPSRAWRETTVSAAGRPFDGWVARIGTSQDLRRVQRHAVRPEDVLPEGLLPAR
jgi:hypothetical protein